MGHWYRTHGLAFANSFTALANSTIRVALSEHRVHRRPQDLGVALLDLLGTGREGRHVVALFPAIPRRTPRAEVYWQMFGSLMTLAAGVLQSLPELA